MPRNASPCSLCGKVFSTAFNLSVHVKVHHFQVKAFDCSVCGRKFGYKHTLRNHSYVHLKDSKDCMQMLRTAIYTLTALLIEPRKEISPEPVAPLEGKTDLRIRDISALRTSSS